MNTLKQCTESRRNAAFDRILSDMKKPMVIWTGSGIPAKRLGDYVATCREVNGMYAPEIIHPGGHSEVMNTPTHSSALDAMEVASTEIGETIQSHTCELMPQPVLDTSTSQIEEPGPFDLNQYCDRARRANEDGDLAC